MKKINLFDKYSIRNTYPRRKIIESIASLGRRHFSVDDLIHHLKRKKIRISRASTYRAINLFSRRGFLRPIDVGRDCYLYELGHLSSHHDHIYCLRCGRIIEFEEKGIEQLQKSVCRKNRFYPIGHTLRIVGLCKNCRVRHAKDI